MLKTPRPRLIATFTALACLTLLIVSAWLSPSGDGHGTHTQLGMPPCAWAMWLDSPCATCGMTTAFAHAADGDLAGSFVTQPMGMMLAVVVAAVFWGGVYQASTGSRVDAAFARLLRGRAIAGAGALVLASWVYKIITWDSPAF